MKVGVVGNNENITLPNAIEFAAQTIIISFVQSVFFFDLFRYDIRNYFSV